MDYNRLADISLAGETLTDNQCQAVLNSPDDDLLALLHAAYRVRRATWGNKVQLHVLTNAKSGICPEDCHYCSQSAISTANIERYSLMSEEKLMEAARRAKAAKAFRYCMVISARGPSEAEVDALCKTVRRIKSEIDIGICCSVGLLDPDQARRFKEAGVDRINHNLNTSESHYENICTSHTYRDRIDTLRACREAGLQLCSGAIFGQGETDGDAIELSRAIRELEIESIPINFLIPIEGTPFNNADTGLTPTRCLKLLSLVRFLNPTREIRIAGGREVHLRSLQPLGLYPANSIFVRGYLTEPGQDAPDAWKMIEDLGFEIDLSSGSWNTPCDAGAIPAGASTS